MAILDQTEHLSNALIYPPKTFEMINSTYQVTFGIEVECVLAFHETHLAGLKTHSAIVKHIPEAVRRKLNQVSQHYLDDDARHHDPSRQMYMGWGLTAPTEYPAERDNSGFQNHFETHLAQYGYRAYGGEVLQIAQTLLPKGVEVHDSFHSRKYHADFSHWHLTHERGLVGVDKEDLTQRLDGLSSPSSSGATSKRGYRANIFKRPNMVAEEWDTHPLELVSRVLPYDSASIAEIHQHLRALKEGPMHFAFATKHCGLHVHVGLPVPAKYVRAFLSFFLSFLLAISLIPYSEKNQISPYLTPFHPLPQKRKPQTHALTTHLSRSIL